MALEGFAQCVAVFGRACRIITLVHVSGGCLEFPSISKGFGGLWEGEEGEKEEKEEQRGSTAWRRRITSSSYARRPPERLGVGGSRAGQPYGTQCQARQPDLRAVRDRKALDIVDRTAVTTEGAQDDRQAQDDPQNDEQHARTLDTQDDEFVYPVDARSQKCKA